MVSITCIWKKSKILLDLFGQIVYFLDMNQIDAENEILYHRYLYYVKCDPILSDYEYDRLEKKYLDKYPESDILKSVSSDREEDYPKHIRNK